MSFEELAERLEHLEKLVLELLEKVTRLEEFLQSASLEASLATEIALGLSIPVLEAVEAAKRIARVLSMLNPDPLTKAVLEALADCSALSISEVYRRVKALRGKASRTTVAKRLRMLEEQGVVVNVGTSSRPRYRLVVCTEG